ncbi:hypothetical protein J2798_003958 [Herbaspirillum seropedicae]|nr:hypothetical protein [Herbaspirillum seropedicae]
MISLSTAPFSAAFDTKHRIFISQPRHCPKCIAEDIDIYGEPYWHTEHQILNVSVCVKHSLVLNPSCCECKNIVGVRGQGLIGALTHICICGTDLRRGRRRKIDKDEMLHRFATFCLAALHERDVDWSNSQVIGFLKRRFKRHELDKLLNDDWRNTYNFEIGWGPTVATRTIDATGIAAALVSLNFEYAEAKQEFRKSDPDSPSKSVFTSDPKLTIENITLATARTSMVEFLDKNPTFTPSRNVLAYAYLSIYDHLWLQRLGGKKYSRILKTPSIDADRTRLLEFLELKKPLSQAAPIPYMRAQIRDTTWLSTALVHRTVSRTNVNNERRLTSANRAHDIQKVIDSAENAILRPTRISNLYIAQRTGLSIAQVDTAMLNNKSLRDLRNKMNRKLREIKIIATFNDLSRQRTHVSLTVLALKSGLTPLAHNKDLVRKVIAKYTGSEYYPIPEHHQK